MTTSVLGQKRWSCPLRPFTRDELARRWWTVGATGLVGVALASIAGPAAYALLGNAQPQVVEDVRGPFLPLVLAAAVLASGLLRAPNGRTALLVLCVLAAVPLAARWSEPTGMLGAGTVVLAAGYAVGQRGRRRIPSTPDPL